MNHHQQLESRAQLWQVTVTDVLETAGSLIGFGSRGSTEVVLKIAKQRGDEWSSGEVLRAFNGDGIVRLFESDGGAALLERLRPATELVELIRRGDDEGATKILAQVIQKLSHHEPPSNCPRVHDWSRGFDRYLASKDTRLSLGMVTEARDVYLNLATSQRNVMLLHGDLHHYNVLLDERRGWVAIDPKGVVGELEYEIGAVLRNPVESPELLGSATVIERRVELFVNELQLDFQRTLEWVYAQAVLSAIWEIEDTNYLKPDNPSLRLARALRPMLD
jgi:streptomycin 6-kinase